MEENTQTEKFLKETNTQIKITFKGFEVFPAFDDERVRPVYFVSLYRNRQRFSFQFGDSEYNMRHHIDLTPYDILACLTKSDPRSLEDFLDECGYTYSKKSVRLYGGIKEEWKQVKKMFGDVIDDLAEIY